MNYTSNAKIKDNYMRLFKEPYSTHAIKLIDTLYDEARLHLSRVRKSVPLKKAIGGIIADLLSIPETKKGKPCAYRCVGKMDFWESPVDYEPFTQARRALEALGYIDVEIGFKSITGSTIPSQATKFRRTAKLDDLLATFGIDVANREDHFRNRHPSETLPCPIEMRNASTKKYGNFGEKTRGKKVKPNFSSPKVRHERDRMRRMNNFLFRQTFAYDHMVEGATIPFSGLVRIFNNENKRGPKFEGGRMYARFSGYQSLQKGLRQGLRINGEPVAEIDVGSCFLAIFTHQNDGKVDPSVDMYVGCSIPRDIAKKFVGQTMGSQKLPRQWAKELKDEWIKDQENAGVANPTKLQDAYPIAKVRAAVLEALPVLRRWNDSPIRWGNLFYDESEAMLAAMEDLMEQGIVSLPLHDALIVPVSKVEEAKSAITKAFQAVIGFTPMLKVK